MNPKQLSGTFALGRSNARRASRTSTLAVVLVMLSLPSLAWCDVPRPDCNQCVRGCVIPLNPEGGAKMAQTPQGSNCKVSTSGAAQDEVDADGIPLPPPGCKSLAYCVIKYFGGIPEDPVGYVYLPWTGGNPNLQYALLTWPNKTSRYVMKTLSEYVNGGAKIGRTGGELLRGTDGSTWGFEQVDMSEEDPTWHYLLVEVRAWYDGTEFSAGLQWSGDTRYFESRKLANISDGTVKYIVSRDASGAVDEVVMQSLYYDDWGWPIGLYNYTQSSVTHCGQNDNSGPPGAIKGISVQQWVVDDPWDPSVGHWGDTITETHYRTVTQGDGSSIRYSLDHGATQQLRANEGSAPEDVGSNDTYAKYAVATHIGQDGKVISLSGGCSSCGR